MSDRSFPRIVFRLLVVVSFFGAFAATGARAQSCLNIRPVDFPGWGVPPTVDPNARPTMTSACGAPAEYDCPLFENRPHEELNQSILALMNAMTVTAECKELGSVNTFVTTNANQLQTALQVLRGPFDPANAAPVADSAELQRNVQLAVESAKALGDVFSGSPFLNSHCGQSLNKSGNFLVAITDLLNGLTPFALMGAAVNPALGTAARLALTGGSLATSAVSSVISLVNQGNLDMNNPVVRRAVLKNTCLFTKIARKANFMQLAQSSAVDSLKQDMRQHEAEARSRFAETSDSLKAQVKYREGVESQAVLVESQLRRDQFELRSLEAEFDRFKGDELSTCERAEELVDVSASSIETSIVSADQRPAFPTSLVANLNQAVSILRGTASGLANSPYYTLPTTPPAPTGSIFDPFGTAANTPSTTPAATTPPATEDDPINSQQETDIATLKSSNHQARGRISALRDKVQANDEKAIRYCAFVARSWVKTLRAIHTLTGQIVNSERVTIDDVMSKDPEYAAWKKQADQLKFERISISRFAKVMAVTEQDNSLIDRTDLVQNMDLLRNALFGHRGGWSVNHSPIEQWLDHVMKLHSGRIASFRENVRDLQVTAASLAAGKSVVAKPTVNAVFLANSPLSSDLSELTIERVSLGSRAHEVLCQRLQTAWLDWTAANDFLEATDFMCRMIDPYIDNKVEPALVGFCVGNERVESANTSSRYVRARKALGEARGGEKSDVEWAHLILAKLRENQCPLPSVTVLGE